MKNPILFLLLFFPAVLFAQIVKESSTIIKDFGSERWEQSKYELRQYEITDSAVLAQLTGVLMPNGRQSLPKDWYFLMFVDQIQDTLMLRVELQPWAYKLNGLYGFFQIEDIDVLVYNKHLPFLRATKSAKTFTYKRHTYMIGDDNWVEFPGDDCSHSWNLIYHNNSLSYSN